ELLEQFPILEARLGHFVGALEWGWYLRYEVAVTHVARDAARTGALVRADRDPAGTAEARAWDALQETHLDPTTAELVGSVDGGPYGPVLTLTVSVPYAPLVGLVPTPARLSARHALLLEDR
ncbi:MAG TPA: hypothetical protein PKA64_07090, partial [Myxococcota bacterium]|nr:hypothetical protein [Myxococcota bacterium]